MRIRCFHLCFLLLTAVGGNLAMAQQGPGPDAAVARGIFEDARRSYNVGRWQEAIEGFERAYKLSGDPVLLFNLGQAHRQAGHGAEALRAYRAFLREQPAAANRAAVEAHIARLEAATKSASPPGLPPPTSPQASSPSRPEPLLGMYASVEPSAPAPRAVRWLPWATGGLTLLAAGGAAAAGLMARQRFDELRSDCGQTAAGCPDSQVDALKSRVLLTNILIGVAAASAVATGVAIYVDQRQAVATVAWTF